MREHTCDIFQKHSYQPWIIHQDHQELSQTDRSIPNKLTKTYISFHGKQSIWEKLFLTNAYDTKCMQSKIQGCLYITLHMPCKMQEMHKGKLYICYKPSAPRGDAKRARHHRQKRAPTHPTQEIKHTPSPPANEWKLLVLGVWWKYRLFGHVWVHGSKLSSLFDVVSQKMIPHFYVLGFGMEH
jgi:hypothetical protein